MSLAKLYGLENTSIVGTGYVHPADRGKPAAAIEIQAAQQPALEARSHAHQSHLHQLENLAPSNLAPLTRSSPSSAKRPPHPPEMTPRGHPAVARTPRAASR